MSEPPLVDVLGIGQNAVDKLILGGRYPAYMGKERYEREIVSAGGQVATAILACARLGLRVAYAGTVGEDEAGRIQIESLCESGIDTNHVLVRPNTATQSAYILIDDVGERTILWRRDAALELKPDEVPEALIQAARLIHIDAGDTEAAIRSATIARSAGVLVSLDADTLIPDLDRLFGQVDYLVAAKGLLETFTGKRDPEGAIVETQKRFGCRVVAITLGAEGAAAVSDGEVARSRGFAVDCVDTTGAGDVFHGALCYSVLQAMPIPQALEFANAMAALNCTALGARGHLAALPEIQALIATGRRYTPAT